MLTLLRRCFRVLPHRDQKRVKVIIGAQLSLSLLDLVAVAIFGALGSIAIRGIQSRDSSSFLDPVLKQVGMADLDFQSKVATLALIASLLLITKTLLSTIITRRSLHFLAIKGADLSSRLSRNALIDAREEIEDLPSQEVLYALTTGVSNVTLGVLGTFIALASDISLLVLMSVALFLTDFVTALVITCFFVLIGLFLYFSLHRKSSRLGKEQANVTIDSNREILTVYRAYPEIFVRNTGLNLIKKISSQRRELATISAETAFLPYVGKYVIESAIVVGVLLLSALQFVSNNAVAASGTLAFFIVSATRIAPAILRLQHGAITMNYSANASILTLELMEQKSMLQDENANREFYDLAFEPIVKFDNVSYLYPKSLNHALSDVSFGIDQGDFVAIVGPTGAGKSTLIEVLLGVRKPTSGSAKISGRLANEVHNIWPGRVAYVPQDVHIHQGSLRENLLLGLAEEKFSDEALLDALQKVGLSEFIARSSITLDSTIGEEGSTLSGGQRQRIGIARAILTKPEMLVLDEATSSLDGVTELEISAMFKELKSVSTLIVIAHRLSTIRESNKLVYLQDGTLRFSGSIEGARREIPDFDNQARLMGLN